MTGPSDLERFVRAQDDVYRQALDELRNGFKRSHWIWFIFPQILGLSTTPTGKFYSIADLAEARRYLGHDLLGPRLMECVDAMLAWQGKRDAVEILGEVDAMKLASSMTLFERAGDDPRFGEMLDGFYGGTRDELTLDLLAR